jgi:hypothetical protein
MELIDDHRVYLVRLEPDLWAEIERGTLTSLELLRPGRTARLPEFRPGDVLLLYRPQAHPPDATPAELSHVVSVRLALSNDAGYGLGPLFRMMPSLGRERLLFASQQGSLPELFKRADDRTFVLILLASDQRDQFLEFVLNAEILLTLEEGKGGRPEMEPVGETPVIVEFEW